MVLPPGRPKAKRAPSGGSAVHAVFSKSGVATSVGAKVLPPGRPKAKRAPSGGSVLHAVKSVGAIYTDPLTPSTR